ncbi:NAD(P)/FAD-dependent oxidoreductase [Salibacterium salarium]|uniref:NAD(P)/FAD-dependent oxidoreductase n=1 Tax=Salibacterium salarium TaxID=284579 RepID=UPI00163AD576|nr:FAD-dependent oxidoreductase [Salibacterium salarium]
MSQHVLFIGAGQTNLSVLKNWKKRVPSHVEWTLASPSRYHYYSGMFSGFMEGKYSLDDIRIDVKAFCQQHGGRFIEEKITAVDKNRNIVLTENGKSIPYDHISADIGSRPAGGSVRGVREHALFLEPHEQFPSTAEKMQQTEYPVIVGGGFSAVELALSLQVWRQKHRKKTPVTLISATPVLPNEKKEVREELRNLLDERGILLYENTPVDSLDSQIIYAGNEMIGYGEVLWAAGKEAPLLFDYANLPVDEKGYLLVSSTLQSLGDATIFGSGDCVTIDQYPMLSKDAVSSIRQAEVLEENVLRKLKSKPKLKHFRPQKKYATVLNLGSKQGLYLYGDKHSISKSAWKLKNRLDKSFMKQF